MAIKKEFLDYLNRVQREMKNPPRPQIGESVCCWMDLLGFGSTFYDANWNPSKKKLKSLYSRITNAQKACYLTVLPTGADFVFMLNDGLVRCGDPRLLYHIDLISFWLKGCIMAHLDINNQEKKVGLPGARTVLCHGLSMNHGHSEFRFDDFVSTYTKPDPSKLSRSSVAMGNPLIIVNPRTLQLNTAFSKAYILESGGSKIGLKGANLYIDESILHFVRKRAKKFKLSYPVVFQEDDTFFLFAVPATKNGSRYHLGFELSKPPIIVETHQLQTTVYRVEAFYPCDENTDFKFKLV